MYQTCYMATSFGKSTLRHMALRSYTLPCIYAPNNPSLHLTVNTSSAPACVSSSSSSAKTTNFQWKHHWMINDTKKHNDILAFLPNTSYLSFSVRIELIYLYRLNLNLRWCDSVKFRATLCTLYISPIIYTTINWGPSTFYCEIHDQNFGLNLKQWVRS